MKKIMAIVVSVMVLCACLGVVSTEAISIGGNKVVVKTGDKGSSKQTTQRTESQKMQEKQDNSQSTKEPQEDSTKPRKDRVVKTLSQAQEDPNYVHIEKNRFYYLKDSLKCTSENPLTFTLTLASYPQNNAGPEVMIVYNEWQIVYRPMSGSSKLEVRVTSLHREEYIDGKLRAVLGKGMESPTGPKSTVGTLAAQLYEEKTGKSARTNLDRYEDYFD